MVYLITYDLNKQGKDYSGLYLALSQYDYIRDPGLDSVWFVSTTWNSSQIYEHLRVHFDLNDRIFISQIFNGCNYGWMNSNVWNWINSKVLL